MTETLETMPIKEHVPIIDIIFGKGINGSVTDTMANRRIVCSFPKEDVLTNATYNSSGYLESVSPRVMTKFTRKINKNPIYINFPVETETGGGYAYDLGFTEDTMTFALTTMEWSEYEKLCTLVKLNTGEKPATVHVGMVPTTQWDSFKADTTYQSNNGWTDSAYSTYGCHTYECIIRNSDATLEPGTQMINYNIECTVVYNE